MVPVKICAAKIHFKDNFPGRKYLTEDYLY